MDRRTFVGGIAWAAFSHASTIARCDDGARDGFDDQVAWRRYAAKRDGRRPSVILLHGTRGFEFKLSAYERYANALTAERIDAYLFEYYAPIDSATVKVCGLRRIAKPTTCSDTVHGVSGFHQSSPRS
jgi:carboxymethylenebutenolidase